jgi:hypothetical protein
MYYIPISSGLAKIGHMPGRSLGKVTKSLLSIFKERTQDEVDTKNKASW